MRRLVPLLAAIAAGAGLAAAAPSTPDPTTPQAELLLCVRPTKGTALPPVLDGAPRARYVERIAPNQQLEVPGLRISIASRLLPARVGATHGELVARLDARLVPDADRDGESADNSLDEVIGYAPSRLGGFRIAATPVEQGKAFDVEIVDLGCREAAQERPLRKGASRLVWISTQATRSYAFREGPWHEVVAEDALAFDLRTGLGHDPAADPTQPRAGYIVLAVWDRVGAMPDSVELGYPQLVAGKRLALRQYKVEIVRTVLGDGTVDVDGWPHTTGGRDPDVSVLVRVTRT